ALTGARGGRGGGFASRDLMGSGARAAGARFLSRPELARGAQPLGCRPFHRGGRNITAPRLAQLGASTCRFHSSHGRLRTALLVSVALAASSAVRKLTSP